MRTTPEHTIERPTAELLQALTAERDGPCVTVLVRREFAGDASDSIRLKSALRRASQELVSQGVEERRADAMLQPLRSLLDDRDLWISGSGSLCLYVAPDMLRIVEIPGGPGDVVEVGPRFRLRPILRAMQENAEFYVLALSLGSVRLLRCDGESALPVDIATLPGDISEGPRRFKDYEPSQQFYTADRPARGRTAMWHGHGVGKDDEEIDEREFFAAVGDVLRDANLELPIVLACDRPRRPTFLEQSGLENVLPEGPDGNPDHLSDSKLHEQAIVHLRAALAERRKEEAERIRAAEPEKLAESLSAVIGAARTGRVDVLLLRDDARVWGREQGGRIVTNDDRRPGDVELTNEAAILALRTGGTVHLVESVAGGGRDEDASAVALLRW